MPTALLPCRHRGTAIEQGVYPCLSPKLVGLESVTAETCRSRYCRNDRVVRLEIALSWMLSMLAGTVQQRIEQKARDLLGHKPG